MQVVFDTLNVYYIPQYAPLILLLKQRGHQVKLVCYNSKNEQDKFAETFSELEVDCIWVEDEKEARDIYTSLKPDWIFFGNKFDYLDAVHQFSKTAQLGHGVGPKPSYYHKSSTPMTVRFIEGSLRLSKIRELYPRDNFVQVGFSKLDPMYDQTEPGFDLEEFGLSPEKPTILYAPTFNPSSLERFPDNWPKHFSNYNILIKPHSLTQVRPQYKNQRAKLSKWAQFPNTYVASDKDLSLLPFMKNADILLSEASSTLFEFAALDKPVVVCNFFKLKWSYRGVFHFRFKKRFGKDNVLYSEIGKHAQSFKDLLTVIPQQLAVPEEYHERRRKYTDEHVGPTDGLASMRIAQYIESH